MLKIVSLFTLCLLNLPYDLTTKDHDIHVSRCEIQYNEESGSFEVAAQIYLDDFQSSMSKNGIPDLHLFTAKEVKEADQHIGHYLSKKLNLTADGKSLTGSFVGREQSEDLLAIWCYVEFKAKPDFKQLKIKYDAIMDIYDDQRNILNVKAKGKKGYALLSPKQAEETIQY